MNIREIAKRANVSTATVSRVLNGHPRVSEETRQRVLRVIAEANYVPNGVARSMSHGKTSILGLVLPDITNPFFPGIARGVEDAAGSFGYRVILCNTDNDRDTEASYLRTLREQRVDGIILVGTSHFDEAEIRALVGDIPLVWCDRVPASGASCAVLTDHYQGARLAVGHLLELGHRDIAMIAGPPVSAALERQRAFLDVLHEAGMGVPEHRMVQGDFRYDSGWRAMNRILEDETVTAVFCANDMMAFGAINAIFQRGLRVPEQISVIGYDNILFAEWSRPALTTVAQPIYLLGVQAVELLMDAMEGTISPPVRRLLEPTLVIRNSTARVNA
ncbi:MAG: LacI family DNA-binding transcriptional regulator [Thermoflavifilum sp.]|nr:LacI family DNA-binding transcriptional regulator [Thermoflavifilum sp.]MCL6515105.1 LacI family transcriptional regulator [Alicyclobacillus sp.]